MAKKSISLKEIKKKKLVIKFIEKRKDILNYLRNIVFNKEKLIINKKLQKLPINSSPIRLRNRCSITGKPRGFYRFFGLSRNMLRDFGHKSLLPGLIKASW